MGLRKVTSARGTWLIRIHGKGTVRMGAGMNPYSYSWYETKPLRFKVYLVRRVMVTRNGYVVFRAGVTTRSTLLRPLQVTSRVRDLSEGTWLVELRR